MAIKRTSLYILLVMLLLLPACAPKGTPANTTRGPDSGTTVLMEDHFTGNALDPGLWVFIPTSEGSTFSVEGNRLNLRSSLQEGGAARLNSVMHFFVGGAALVFETSLFMDSPTVGMWGFTGHGVAYFSARRQGAVNAIAGPGATIESKGIPIYDIDVTGEHIYRIELSSLEARFYVDDMLKTTIPMDIPADNEMTATLERDYDGSGGLLSADFVRISQSAVP